MSDEIKKEVVSLVAKYSEAVAEELSQETKLQDTGIDSVGVAELIFDLEDKFDITIEDSDDIQTRFNLGTIGDLVKMVNDLALVGDEA